MTHHGLDFGPVVGKSCYIGMTLVDDLPRTGLSLVFQTYLRFFLISSIFIICGNYYFLALLLIDSVKKTLILISWSNHEFWGSEV